jgi:hypothetical protein
MGVLGSCRDAGRRQKRNLDCRGDTAKPGAGMGDECEPPVFEDEKLTGAIATTSWRAVDGVLAEFNGKHIRSGPLKDPISSRRPVSPGASGVWPERRIAWLSTMRSSTFVTF